jgi:hypothetical protein
MYRVYNVYPIKVYLLYSVYLIIIRQSLSIVYRRCMISTMKISEETKRALLKIAAEHTIKDGKERSLEDTVKILIEEHKANLKKH